MRAPIVRRRKVLVSARELPAYLEAQSRRAAQHKVADLARDVQRLQGRIRALEDASLPYEEVKQHVLDYYEHVGHASPARVARVLGYGETFVQGICDELVAQGELGPAGRREV